MSCCLCKYQTVWFFTITPNNDYLNIKYLKFSKTTFSFGRMFRLGACVMLIAVGFVAQITADDEEARLNAHCGSDPNAIIGCQPDYCGQVCFNFAATELACTGRCVRKGCRCVDGYKFDPNALKCVPEAECTRPVAVPLGDGAALN